MLMSNLEDSPANSWMTKGVRACDCRAFIYFLLVVLTLKLKYKQEILFDFLIGGRFQAQGAERRRVTH